MHMLNLAPGYRESLPKFLELLLDSRPAAEAFQTAFGRTLDKALADLSGYVNRMRSTTVGFARGEAAAPPVVSRVAPVTALLLRADLSLHVDRASIARGLFQKAAATFRILRRRSRAWARWRCPKAAGRMHAATWNARFSRSPPAPISCSSTPCWSAIPVHPKPASTSYSAA
jgi:hypothetical protein